MELALVVGSDYSGNVTQFSVSRYVSAPYKTKSSSAVVKSVAARIKVAINSTQPAR